MKIFLNRVPLKILKPGKVAQPEHYQVHLDGPDEKLVPSRFINHVLFTNASLDQIVDIVNFLGEHVFHDAKSITIVTDDYESARELIKSKFQVIEAAGGIIRKSGKILMIFRYGRWDFPKGKIEKGESPKVAAVREVEEECNILVRRNEKIGNTWHTFTLNGRRILKKTHWYAMDCLDDSNMKPQVEEGIEDIKWMKSRELFEALKGTYPSIQHIFQKYQKKRDLHLKISTD